MKLNSFIDKPNSYVRVPGRQMIVNGAAQRKEIVDIDILFFQSQLNEIGRERNVDLCDILQITWAVKHAKPAAVPYHSLWTSSLQPGTREFYIFLIEERTTLLKWYVIARPTQKNSPSCTYIDHFLSGFMLL